MVSAFNKARQVTGADAAEAARDSEFWGPSGLGCAHCHEEPAIVFGLPFATGALGERCLLRAMFPWDFERVSYWLDRQRGVYVRQEERKAALKAYREGDRSGVGIYRHKYGVDLVAA